MAPPNQSPDRSDSQPQNDTQERDLAQPWRTASASDLNHNNSPQAIRLVDGPRTEHVLVARQRLSDNISGSTGLGFRTESPPPPSEQRLEDAEDPGSNPGYLRASLEYQVQRQQQRITDLQAQRIMLSRERIGTLDAILQPGPALALGQDALLNSSQQLAQRGQTQGYMPSLRSQPEFYMTGVTNVNTTAEPLADEAECTICLEPLLDDVIKFQACGHMFHTVCVQSWFDQSAPRTGHKRGTCPNCRHELYEPDPQYGHTAPSQDIDRGMFGVARPLASSRGESFGRPVEATNTIAPSRAVRHREFVVQLQRNLAQQERAEPVAETVQREAVTSQRQLTIRRAPRARSELTSGNLADAVDRARDDPSAQEDALSLPTRTSSLPRGGAIRRQQASHIMTDALRVTASPGNSHSGDERLGSATSSMPLERPSASITTVNGSLVQPRESRATLAARAIAQRRPLSSEPGLNNGAADPAQSVQGPASNAQSTIADRTRGSRRIPTPAERIIRDLQHEQNVLLDRLREVQNHLDRHLQESDDNGARRANVVLRLTQHRLPHGTLNDSSNRRPPPITIPYIANPAISDLRSAREFLDPTAIGFGTSIWSADYATPIERTTQTQAPHGRHVSPLPSRLSPRPTAGPPTGVTDSDDRILLSPVSTFSETSSVEQPAPAENPRSLSEADQQMQELQLHQTELRRLVSNGVSFAQSFENILMDDNAPETRE